MELTAFLPRMWRKWKVRNKNALSSRFAVCSVRYSRRSERWRNWLTATGEPRRRRCCRSARPNSSLPRCRKRKRMETTPFGKRPLKPRSFGCCRSLPPRSPPRRTTREKRKKKQTISFIGFAGNEEPRTATSPPSSLFDYSRSNGLGRSIPGDVPSKSQLLPNHTFSLVALTL